LLRKALPMSPSAANPAVMPARETLVAVTVASAKCLTPCVPDAADPARFLSSRVMIALFIAAIASAIDNRVKSTPLRGVLFLSPVG